MDIICPKNKRHKRFSATAHVTQEWEVDKTGEFKKVITDCLEATHRPNVGDHFTCAVCGSIAEVQK